MESSRRDLIDMIVDTFIFNNNIIKVSPYFPFIPPGVRLPKIEVSFWCESEKPKEKNAVKITVVHPENNSKLPKTWVQPWQGIAFRSITKSLTENHNDSLFLKAVLLQ